MQDRKNFQTRPANKALYLDFDRVLHDEQVFFHPRKGIILSTLGKTLFEWMPILEQLLISHPGATFHRRKMRKDEFLLLPRGEQIANDVFRRGPKSWFAFPFYPRNFTEIHGFDGKWEAIPVVWRHKATSRHLLIRWLRYEKRRGRRTIGR